MGSTHHIVAVQSAAPVQVFGQRRSSESNWRTSSRHGLRARHGMRGLQRRIM